MYSTVLAWLPHAPPDYGTVRYIREREPQDDGARGLKDTSWGMKLEWCPVLHGVAATTVLQSLSIKCAAVLYMYSTVLLKSFPAFVPPFGVLQ